MEDIQAAQAVFHRVAATPLLSAQIEERLQPAEEAEDIQAAQVAHRQDAAAESTLQRREPA